MVNKGVPAKKREPKPCTHVEVEMVAYMAGMCVGPRAGEHRATMWCVRCGALIHKRYEGGEAREVVQLPRRPPAS